MGPYCKFCDNRCFVHDPTGGPLILATCAKGKDHDRRSLGYDVEMARAKRAEELAKVDRLEPAQANRRFGFPSFATRGETWEAADGSTWTRGAVHWVRATRPTDKGNN